MISITISCHFLCFIYGVELKTKEINNLISFRLDGFSFTEERVLHFMCIGYFKKLHGQHKGDGYYLTNYYFWLSVSFHGGVGRTYNTSNMGKNTPITIIIIVKIEVFFAIFEVVSMDFHQVGNGENSQRLPTTCLTSNNELLLI